MPSGAPSGLGEPNGRLSTLSQVLTAVGLFVLEFPEEFDAFTWQVVGGTPAARDVLVGFAKQDPSSKANLAGVQDVVDVTHLMGVKNLHAPTRWVFVYVAVAVAGATIHVTGVDGEPLPAGGGLSSPGSSQVAVQRLVQNVNEDQTLGAEAEILAANDSRKGFSIRNVGDGTIHLNFVDAAATTDDYELQPGDVYEHPLPSGYVYLGRIRGIEGTVSTIAPNVRKLEWR